MRIAAARRVPGASEAVTGRIDVEAALAHRDYMTSNWHDEGQLPWLDEHKITLVRGSGRIDGERMVIVETPDNGTRRLSVVQAVVLATGTSAALPPIEGLAGLDHGPTGTSPAPRLPRRLVVVEAARSGSRWPRFAVRLEEVTVLERSRDCLREEPFAGDEVRVALEAEGITVVTDAAVDGCAGGHGRSGDGGGGQWHLYR